MANVGVSELFQNFFDSFDWLSEVLILVVVAVAVVMAVVVVVVVVVVVMKRSESKHGV